MVTIVYRKTTSNNMYLNRNLFAPTSWKRETLKTIDRTYLICSSLNFGNKKFNISNKYFMRKMIIQNGLSIRLQSKLKQSTEL